MTVSHTPYHASRRSGRLVEPVSEHRPTRHPGICLISGFGFIVAMAVTVHYAFALLLN